MVDSELPGIAKLRPLTNQSKLSDEAAMYLREAIVNGTLPPGTHLVEQEIAKQLGISRIPVREAIQKLAEEGLVLKEPRKGAYVQPYSDVELEEIYSLRVVLERFVIERVIANWSEQAANQLQKIADSMLKAANAGNKRRVSELDKVFHETLWELAEHNLLLEVVSGLRARITRFLREANIALTPDALTTHAEGHQKLVDILQSGNVETAKTKITLHILGAKNRIKAYYQERM
jgi:DNA-binding GntR family transcriptional regulator